MKRKEKGEEDKNESSWGVQKAAGFRLPYSVYCGRKGVGMGWGESDVLGGDFVGFTSPAPLLNFDPCPDGPTSSVAKLDSCKNSWARLT